MSHKSKRNPLGRSLIKEKFGGKRQFSGNDASSTHMREYAQVAENTAVNLKSVTELNSLDEFLETAQLAGTEFTAERLNIHYVHAPSLGIVSDVESEMIRSAQERYKDSIRIPRRPEWNENMTAEELEGLERESFLEWRRSLADIQEQDNIMLTPYEKNLDFWRQLWRVIERSDLIVQIVDARNPVLYRCEDLEKYVTGFNDDKKNMILINKADLLSEKQRIVWAEYFDQHNITVAFWSATLEAENTSEDDNENQQILINGDDDINMSRLLSKFELIEFFKGQLPSNDKTTKTIGMVGYPNVGKSSTINTILQAKKVAVSATPGRTKHFQTFFIEKDLVLCDCPGLVFPSFVTNKAEMVLSGILPIDEIRDHIPPINLICNRIPRKVLEVTYGINIPKPLEGECRVPTSAEFLDSYGLMRGFMTSRGLPDNPRCSRIILKDYVKGKLLYCYCPPDGDQDEFSSWSNSLVQKVVSGEAGDESATSEEISIVQKRADRVEQHQKLQNHEVDNAFFSAHNVKAFTKGSLAGETLKGGANDGKSWKKHHNKNKKEKMRRTRNGL